MNRLLNTTSYFLAVGLVANAAQASLTFLTHTETRLNHSTFSHTIAESPAPFASMDGGSTGYDGFSGFTLNASYSIEDATTLRTNAFVSVSGNVTDDPLVWDTISSTARAKSSVTTLGLVQDFGSATGGFIDIVWAVSGTSRIIESPDSGVTVSANALTQLTTSLTALPLLDELHFNPGTYPAASTVVTTTVPWEPGTIIPIFFELESTVSIDASNGDTPPGGFFAEAEADFGNTVILDVENFVVRDASMTPIAGASFQVVAVPEPSSFMFFLLSATACWSVRWLRARVLSGT